jgi:hydrogenase nickel incorporation protein HypA/HybF
MHEMALAQNIVEIAQQHVAVELRMTVRSIKLRIGDLAGVVPESLAFCFAAIVQDTDLGQARLDIERLPIIVRCQTCGSTMQTEFPFASCESCHDSGLTVVSGSELQVVEIELVERAEEENS